jgi:hypothetical protein
VSVPFCIRTALKNVGEVVALPMQMSRSIRVGEALLRNIGWRSSLDRDDLDLLIEVKTPRHGKDLARTIGAMNHHLRVWNLELIDARSYLSHISHKKLAGGLSQRTCGH